jgi:threonine/homoserine/homoserine lactone efflux protein
MDPEIWVAFATFAFVSAATPGPNNIILFASGLRAGFVGALPFLGGIALGFGVLLIATGYGLGRLFESIPVLQLMLKVVGSAYFLWLAYKLMSANSASADGEERTFGVFSGALFQIVNPKAWVMTITAISLYLPQDWTLWTLLLMVATFWGLGLPANACWAGAGQLLAKLLSDPRRMRLVNLAMAVLLALSIITVWIPIG